MSFYVAADTRGETHPVDEVLPADTETGTSRRGPVTLGFGTDTSTTSHRPSIETLTPK